MDEKELLTALTRTRAIRAFDKSKKIADADWQALLKVAQNAASSNGLEPWRMIQVEDTTLKQKISEVARGMKRQLASADKIVFFVSILIDENSDFARHVQQDIHGYNDDDFQNWQHSFHALQNRMLTIPNEAWAERQTSIVTGQMLLAAGLLGIDACPMEGFEYPKVEELLKEAGVFDPEHEQLGISLAFGYRAEEPAFPRTRRELSEILEVI